MNKSEPYYTHEDLGLQQGDKYGIQILDKERSSEDELLSLDQWLNDNQVVRLKFTHKETLQLRWKLDKVLREMDRRVEEPLDLKQEIDDIQDEIKRIRLTTDSRNSRKRIAILEERKKSLQYKIEEFKMGVTIDA